MKVTFDILQQIPDTIAGVKVLIFRPKVETDTKRPGIVYYHGGGWTILSPGRESSDVCDALACSLEHLLCYTQRSFPACACIFAVHWQMLSKPFPGAIESTHDKLLLTV